MTPIEQPNQTFIPAEKCPHGFVSGCLKCEEGMLPKDPPQEAPQPQSESGWEQLRTQIASMIIDNVNAWKREGRDEHDLWAMDNWLTGTGAVLAGHLATFLHQAIASSVREHLVTIGAYLQSNLTSDARDSRNWVLDYIDKVLPPKQYTRMNERILKKQLGVRQTHKVHDYHAQVIHEDEPDLYNFLKGYLDVKVGDMIWMIVLRETRTKAQRERSLSRLEKHLKIITKR